MTSLPNEVIEIIDIFRHDHRRWDVEVRILHGIASAGTTYVAAKSGASWTVMKLFVLDGGAPLPPPLKIIALRPNPPDATLSIGQVLTRSRQSTEVEPV